MPKRETDFAQVHTATPAVVYTPETREMLRLHIEGSSLPISVVGSAYSHGGHTLLEGGIRLETSKLKDAMEYDPDSETIRVSAGYKWIDVIRHLDVVGRSVAEMQSYANFSVGGSISVNCHGRGTQFQTIAESIVELEVLVLSSMEFMTITREHELFGAVVGGYGLVAIIVGATLQTRYNCKLERYVVRSTWQDAKQVMLQNARDVMSQDTRDVLWYDGPRKTLFYNANIYPKQENVVVHVMWRETDSPLTTQDRVQEHKDYHWKSMVGEQMLRRGILSKYVRAFLEPITLQNSKAVVKRNYEMSYDVSQHEPLLRFPTTTVLQEYFVPFEGDALCDFLHCLWSSIKKYRINVLNVSLRHVAKTTIPILNYAPVHSIAIVLYFNVANSQSLNLSAGNIITTNDNKTVRWTQELIDHALRLGGTFYLPYLLHATPHQFQRAYPSHTRMRELKRKYDPQNRLRNQFTEKYFPLSCVPTAQTRK